MLGRTSWPLNGTFGSSAEAGNLAAAERLILDEEGVTVVAVFTSTAEEAGDSGEREPWDPVVGICVGTLNPGDVPVSSSAQ